MPPNTGSFGIGLGGVDALKNAMQRRGMDASVLDQVSPAAPTGPSEVAGTVPERNVAMQGLEVPVAPAPAGGGISVPVRSGEMEIALKALAGTVKTENKIAEASLGI